MANAIQTRRVVLRTLWACVLLSGAVVAPSLLAPGAWAQSSAQRASVPKKEATAAQRSTAAATSMPSVSGTELDRVVAIVNGELVLDSDVVGEDRMEDFEPYRDVGGSPSREKVIERLINRDLILQQEKLQGQDEVSDAGVAKQIESLRKSLPACKQFHCEMKAGWDKLLASHGFTEKTFSDRWKERMQVLQFIEVRFRDGVHITPAQIQAYYTKTLLPEYKKRGVAPPKLSTISSRVQEVLLQQQVSGLLSDWLKSLRAQGSIVVLHPGEEAP